MNYDEMSIDELGKELINQNKEKYKLENEVSNINKSIGALNSVLAERMMEKEVPMIQVGEHKLTAEIKETFSIDKDVTDSDWDDNDGAFHTWLKEIGEGGMIKTKASVHNATRTSFLKKRRADGKDIPEFIKVSFFKNIKFNASALKREALND